MTLLPSRAAHSRLRWGTLLAVVLIHFAALGAAPFSFTWPGLAMFLVMIYVTACLGITMGYHRLLTHKSFWTYRPVKYLLAVCGCLALQGGPIRWAARHRLHHRDSDQEQDPHTPFVSFLWSHVLWLFYQYRQTAEGKEIDRFADDLRKDSFLCFAQRWHFLIYLAFAGLTYLAGWWIGGSKLGLSLLVWGCLLRTVWVWHATWFVNSATHVWGYRNYSTNDNSRNNWWVALLSFGEGWHNNHHADQRSAMHGHRWWEIDVTHWSIRLLERLGLARDVVEPRCKRLSTKTSKTSGVA